MLSVCLQCKCVYTRERATSLLQSQYCTSLCESIALKFDIKRATNAVQSK